jgi:hypothetical protein
MTMSKIRFGGSALLCAAVTFGMGIAGCAAPAGPLPPATPLFSAQTPKAAVQGFQDFPWHGLRVPKVQGWDMVNRDSDMMTVIETEYKMADDRRLLIVVSVLAPAGPNSLDAVAQDIENKFASEKSSPVQWGGQPARALRRNARGNEPSAIVVVTIHRGLVYQLMAIGSDANGVRDSALSTILAESKWSSPKPLHQCIAPGTPMSTIDLDENWTVVMPEPFRAIGKRTQNLMRAVAIDVADPDRKGVGVTWFLLTGEPDAATPETLQRRVVGSLGDRLSGSAPVTWSPPKTIDGGAQATTSNLLRLKNGDHVRFLSIYGPGKARLGAWIQIAYDADRYDTLPASLLNGLRLKGR